MMSRSKRNVVGLVEVVRERHAGMLDVLINKRRHPGRRLAASDVDIARRVGGGSSK